MGRHVVDQLLQRGQRVRAMTRKPDKAGLPAGVELVSGDLAQPETLPAVLAGVDRVYLFPVVENTEASLARMREAGVSRVVVLSSLSVEHSAPGQSALGDYHLAIERAVEASGIPWTHLRPGAFAGNTLEWARSIRAEGVVRAPYGEAQQTPIHEADIAAVAVAALLDEGHAGAKYPLSGPAAISRVAQVRAIGEAIGRDLRFEEISPEAWRAQVSAFMPAGIIDTLLAYWAASVETPDPVYPDVEKVLGRPPRTFAQWAADNAKAFAAP
ncbi:Hypothetical protein CAP_8772 [Chondromyces apiculatus DSM 436]|uniref:NAD(P)-binding domain-containing protein n=1 Tax=Chondromyces apiculatus DSM 436 TaxID=1192034 RepID=A0A017SVU8_9BACT|nr:Hypothetical protein CAP_8772 [Chondromyces apiculatus DSM 436]